MAYTQPFVLTTVEGHFGTTTVVNDIWRATWKIPVPAGDIPAGGEILAYLTAVSTPVLSFHTNTTLNTGTFTFLDSIAGAVIGTDGKYLGGGAQGTVRYTYGTPQAGSASSVHSQSAAMCVSMRTSLARGRASRGRFYWPTRAILLSSADGLLSPANQTFLIGSAKTLIDAINGASNTHLGVTSYVSVMSNLGAGTTATVGSVSIGRKLDHMESREGKLSEGHVWTDIASTTAVVATERQAADANWRRP